jgi:hypothetical protein
MAIITVVEYLSVQAREPSRASLSSSRSDRAEPGSARYSTEPHRAEPSLARLGSFPALVITLRNKALAKDKILLSLVERLKSSEAKLSAQAEAHKA